MVGLILVPVVPVRPGPPQQPGQHKRRSRSGDGPTGPVVPVFSSQVGRESWRGYTATGRERRYFIINSINNWDNWDSRANATTGAGKICPSFKSLSQLNRDRGLRPPWSSGERVFGVWGLHSLERALTHVRGWPRSSQSGAAERVLATIGHSLPMVAGEAPVNNRPARRQRLRWSTGARPAAGKWSRRAPDFNRGGLIVPSFLELIDQPQDPAALRLRMALEAATSRTKASDRVKTAAKSLDEARALEQQARTLRDGLLADLSHRLDDLAEDDAIGRAHLALYLAEINDDYRPAANDLCKAEDALADARRSLRIAEHEAAKYPLPAPTP